MLASNRAEHENGRIQDPGTLETEEPRQPIQPAPEADEAAESSTAGRGLGLAALFAMVLLPLAAIVVGGFWLWNTTAGRAMVVPGASRVSEDLAPAAADRKRVAVTDQGIDYGAVARGEVFPLREMSSGRHITENGEP